ncbi:hypothetical protein KP509_28G067600 [Ceratopteris richardii]|uniref:Ubiquitin carboxyl-terminal hydrolase n=1 Tax=Ceratopteris richardii TaxID=49495 RepID=A0A8T2REW8_CERRI|nr:hypothetical protein KP509_28G067600 [Ceratopteris richardii]KAH7294344.1 hypothetical protein KP509_28G067600 [Ceratopteris richardii]
MVGTTTKGEEEVAAPSSIVTTAAAACTASIPRRRILFHSPLRTPSAPSCAALTPLNQPSSDAAISPLSHEAAPSSKPMSRINTPPLCSTLVKRIGAGLNNLGNTCFLNSVLQCLTYTPPLASYFQEGLHKTSCRVMGFCAMCSLETHVKQALSSPGRVISPNHLVKNLRCISRSFHMGRQEDAHEYMRYLIEALQKCCPLDAHVSGPSSARKNFIQRIFAGQLQSQVKCSVCAHPSNTYDPFLDLSLDIVKADSLLKALARFTATDILDGDNKYFCGKCRRKVKAHKQFKIHDAPHVLTIQFKRFSSSGGFGGKIDKNVHFDRTLDLSPYVNGKEGKVKYSLYGVLVHAGWSTHSGHYFCFVRTSADIWHRLDDSRVSQVSERSVLEQKAYILFYVREYEDQLSPNSRQHGSTAGKFDVSNTPNGGPKPELNGGSVGSKITHASNGHSSSKVVPKVPLTGFLPGNESCKMSGVTGTLKVCESARTENVDRALKSNGRIPEDGRSMDCQTGENDGKVITDGHTNGHPILNVERVATISELGLLSIKVNENDNGIISLKANGVDASTATKSNDSKVSAKANGGLHCEANQNKSVSSDGCGPNSAKGDISGRQKPEKGNSVSTRVLTNGIDAHKGSLLCEKKVVNLPLSCKAGKEFWCSLFFSASYVQIMNQCFHIYALIENELVNAGRCTWCLLQMCKTM